MVEKRTDLALEVQEMRGRESGIEISTAKRSGIEITVASVHGEAGRKSSGKPEGKYITLDIGSGWQNDKALFEKTALALSAEIKSLLPKGVRSVLVAGLGNESITPDSLGPSVVKGLIVTRHIENIDPELFSGAGFGRVSAIAAGVLAQTGIESAEIIKSIALSVKPECVILIDALASRRLARLATTVQLSSNGISPGSGVSNKRVAIDKELLGVPVVSIGVPTVVDAATLALDIIEEHGGGEEEYRTIADKILSGAREGLFVTPKDNDIIIKNLSRLIASSLNMALHGMTFEESAEFVL